MLEENDGRNRKMMFMACFMLRLCERLNQDIWTGINVHNNNSNNTDLIFQSLFCSPMLHLFDQKYSKNHEILL